MPRTADVVHQTYVVAPQVFEQFIIRGLRHAWLKSPAWLRTAMNRVTAEEEEDDDDDDEDDEDDDERR